MNNNLISNNITFLQLLSSESKVCNCCGNLEWNPLNKIEIPIIQRDYAQGRTGKEEVRNNFLETLKNTLIQNTKLELDFVYGSIKDKVFQPLDGQQRLTTLFLLHWFIAIKENKLNDELKKLLTKFTYETRTSSREFCEELINKGIDYNQKDNISEQIIDNSWFFLSWKRDPTIKSMLTMLDSIEQKFRDTTEVWGKLNNISFYFIELQDFGLSDDLYIKMNARGKPLTDFENFKAKFEQHITKNHWEKDITNPQETFTHKIDTNWTDLFWQYKDENNKIDDNFLKFFSTIAILNYAQNKEIFENLEEEIEIKKILKKKNKSKNVTEDAVKKERIEIIITELANNYKAITPKDFPTAISFDFLKKCLEYYSKDDNDKISLELNLWDITKSGNLFVNSIKINENTTYKTRVLFYAQTLFFLNKSSDLISFNNWMRVVRNIVENSTIDSAAMFISAIDLINELSDGCFDIYGYLSQNNIKSGYSKVQVEHEVIKAKLISGIEGDRWKKLIFENEDHQMYKGVIRFLLDNNENLEIFEKWSNRANYFFANDGIIEKYKKDALLLRALVSQFKDWNQFNALDYDCEKGTWSNILRNEKLIPKFQKLLETNDEADLRKMLLIDSTIEDEKLRLVHEDLYKTKILMAIEKRTRLAKNYNNYVLYPYNAKVDWKKYIVGSERNKILSDKINEEIITFKNENQQLKSNGELIPFFWGLDIPFIYNKVEYIWDRNNKIIKVSTKEEFVVEEFCWEK